MEKTPRPRVQPPLSAFPIVTDGRLTGSRCTDCGHIVFPAANLCSQCLSEATEAFAFSGEGTIYTYTVLHTAARGWEAPYVLGYVDLPEGVRIFTHLTGAAPEDFRIGMPVTMIATAPVVNFEGMEVVSYKFKAEPHAPR